VTEPSASATSRLTAAAPSAGVSPPRRGALLVIATATLLVVLDSTIVNVALPTVRSRLGFSPAGLEWVVTAYSLAFGGLLLLGGRSGDLFGRRRMLVTGLTLFSLASLTAGLAPDPAVLIAARFAQGAGAAIAAPTALSLIAITFPAGPDRNRAMSVYAAMSSTGGALGLILGGILTQYASWRWVFLVAVPIGLTAAAGAARVLPETPAARRSPDLPGALTVTAGLAALVYGLTRASDGTWSSPATIAPLTAAAVLLLLFAAVERVSGQPLLPGRILADRSRATAYGATLTVGLALYGMAFFLMLYCQDVLGYDSITAGLTFLAIAVPLGAAAIGTGRAVTRTGTRPPLLAGLLLAAGGACWLAAKVTPATSHAGLAGPLALFGLGLGLAVVPLTLTALSSIQPADAGVASALVSAAQQVGAAIGLAALGTIAAAVTAHRATTSASALSGGYRTVFYVTAAVLAAAFLITTATLRPRRPRRRQP
jgi:EmrB/QacA subfamily drug resistance transporter